MEKVVCFLRAFAPYRKKKKERKIQIFIDFSLVVLHPTNTHTHKCGGARFQLDPQDDIRPLRSLRNQRSPWLGGRF